MKNSGFLMGKEPTLGRIIRTLLGAFVGVVPGVLIHSYGFRFQGIVFGDLLRTGRCHRGLAL